MSAIRPTDADNQRRLEEDAASRREALELASFIVEAPAGAGKTELLTQRCLRLLAVVEHPEEVVALTFTNKAAMEMRDRILGNLERAATGVPPQEAHKQLTFRLAGAVLARDAECGWGLLRHPGRLRITTIDALCAGLARQMPYLSRFGAQPGIAEKAGTYYQQAARQTIAMLEDEGADAEVVATALAFVNNDALRLERLLVAMLGRRDQWLHHTHRVGPGSDGAGDLRQEVESGLQALVERELSATRQFLDGYRQGLLMPLARFAGGNVPALRPLADWLSPLTGEAGELPCWRALVGLLLTKEGTLRRSLTKNNGFPADAKAQKEAMLQMLGDLAAVDGLEAALDRLRRVPEAQLSDGEWACVENFSCLLQLAAGQLWLAFQEAGEVDFIEISSRASLALGSEEAPTDLARTLDYRIRHLLVDEFQDTSPQQVILLGQLTRDWAGEDGRTLFLVGDPMQSIYRFRKADVGLFLKVRQAGIGNIFLRKLRLYRNNRSCQCIVDWVNGCFPGIFAPADNPEFGAVRYAESAATHPDVPGAGVQWHPLVLAVEEAEAGRREAECLLDIIAARRAADPSGRIAVLVRAKTHLDDLVAEIRRRAPDLPFQAVEIEALAGRQAVQDVLSLTHALLHRADRVHWLAILRAPWCGLTLADLHALVATDGKSTVWQLIHDASRLAALTADGRQRLLALRQVLGESLAEAGRQHPRRWVEGSWLMLGGPSCLAKAGELADVQALFQLMDKLVAGGAFTAERLQEEAEALFAPPSAVAGSDLLQMMTIHKSKGLEFETVILPGLHRDTGNNDAPLLVWDTVAVEGVNEHLLVAPMPARGEAGDSPSAYDYLRKLEDERSRREDERVLYVAATRAIRHLHLVGMARRDAGKADGLKPPARGTPLALLWPQVARAPFVEAAASLGGEVGSSDQGIDSASFVPQLVRLAEVGRSLLLQGDMAAGQPNPPAAGESAASEAAFGTLVHRCLEIIARDGLDDWPAERPGQLGPVYRQWLQRQGLAPAEASALADRAVAALQQTLRSPAGRWLLSDHAEASAELALSRRENGESVQQVIDRSFVADGSRWIIDYKTLLHGGDADDETALRQRAESHRPQLLRYADLFRGEGLPIRTAIFYPCQGCLIELQ